MGSSAPSGHVAEPRAALPGPALAAGDDGGARFWPLLRALPEWMRMVNGQEFCCLCHRFATGPHLDSERHGRFLGAFRDRPWELNSGDAAGTAPPAASSDVTLPDAVPGAALPPTEWGDPGIFEHRTGGWWCRLCWRHADRWHVASARHRRNAEGFELALGQPASAPLLATGGQGVSPDHSGSASSHPTPWGGALPQAAGPPRVFDGVFASVAHRLGPGGSACAAATRLRLPAGWGPAFPLPPAALASPIPGGHSTGSDAAYWTPLPRRRFPGSSLSEPAEDF